jgi:hypothetical protein
MKAKCRDGVKWVCLGWCLAVLSAGCSDTPPAPSSPSTGQETQETDYWQKARELYQQAKESGEQVPEDVKKWVKEDVDKIGTWEYKVVTLDEADPGQLEEELNRLGKERWNCFWVDRREEGPVMYFKRPVWSYLQRMPKGQLWRFIGPG